MLARALSTQLWPLDWADRAHSSAQSRSKRPPEGSETPFSIDFGSILVPKWCPQRLRRQASREVVFEAVFSARRASQSASSEAWSEMADIAKTYVFLRKNYDFGKSTLLPKALIFVALDARANKIRAWIAHRFWFANRPKFVRTVVWSRVGSEVSRNSRSAASRASPGRPPARVLGVSGRSGTRLGGSWGDPGALWGAPGASPGASGDALFRSWSTPGGGWGSRSLPGSVLAPILGRSSMDFRSILD